MSLPQNKVYQKPQNVALFGNRVVARVVSETFCGPGFSVAVNSMTGVFIERGVALLRL